MYGWLLLGGLLLFMLIVLTPLRIELAYRRVSDNDYVNIQVSAWFRLVRFSYELPVMKLLTGRAGSAVFADVKREMGQKQKDSQKKITYPDVKTMLKKYKQFQRRVLDLRETMKWMMRKIRCEQIEWHTRLGFGEAASTGALTGLVWGIKSALVTSISHYITLRTVPRLSVQPVWNGEVIQTQFRCILRFRLGYAMVAGVRILLKTRRRGRERKWQTTPSRA
ncbi:MAG: DUF2953 domain-containing protein [Brevibacillus sp.]|nr:DUF2953 domain-containing protein [Brevibacillus sp.]